MFRKGERFGGNEDAACTEQVLPSCSAANRTGATRADLLLSALLK